jgi:hypothetical protein
MTRPNLLNCGLSVACLLAASTSAQNQTTLATNAPGGQNTVTFDLNHQPTGIVSVTIDGSPADVQSSTIRGTKVIVRFTHEPAIGAGIKVVIQYSGSEPQVQSVSWSNT